MNAVTLGLLALLTGCHEHLPACLADQAETLHLEISGQACDTDDDACRLACVTGGRDDCLGLAYAFQKRNPEAHDADRFFERACALGSAIGCTNFAAAIWASPPSDEALTCARRIFEKSCAVGEKYGCGMAGRLLAEKGDVDGARATLERSCNELGGFPCRALALVLERGAKEPPDPKRIQDLLGRACQGGDGNACGVHSTANETFH